MQVPDGKEYCLEFWYHMFGAHIGSLHVQLAQYNLEGEMYKLSDFLFSKTGEISNTWQKSLVPLPSIPDKFKVFFMGTIGAGFQSDIAIDDVRLHRYGCEDAVTANPISIAPANGICQDNEFSCKSNKKCIKRWFICDKTADCEDGSDEDDEVCVGVADAQLDFAFDYTTTDEGLLRSIFETTGVTKLEMTFTGTTEDPFLKYGSATNTMPTIASTVAQTKPEEPTTPSVFEEVIRQHNADLLVQTTKNPFLIYEQTEVIGQGTSDTTEINDVRLNVDPKSTTERQKIQNQNSQFDNSDIGTTPDPLVYNGVTTEPYSIRANYDSYSTTAATYTNRPTQPQYSDESTGRDVSQSTQFTREFSTGTGTQMGTGSTRFESTQFSTNEFMGSSTNVDDGSMNTSTSERDQSSADPVSDENSNSRTTETGGRGVYKPPTEVKKLDGDLPDSAGAGTDNQDDDLTGSSTTKQNEFLDVDFQIPPTTQSNFEVEPYTQQYYDYTTGMINDDDDDNYSNDENIANPATEVTEGEASTNTNTEASTFGAGGGFNLLDMLGDTATDMLGEGEENKEVTTGSPKSKSTTVAADPNSRKGTTEANETNEGSDSNTSTTKSKTTNSNAETSTNNQKTNQNSATTDNNVNIRAGSSDTSTGTPTESPDSTRTAESDKITSAPSADEDGSGSSNLPVNNALCMILASFIMYLLG